MSTNIPENFLLNCHFVFVFSAALPTPLFRIAEPVKRSRRGDLRSPARQWRYICGRPQVAPTISFANRLHGNGSLSEK